MKEYHKPIRRVPGRAKTQTEQKLQKNARDNTKAFSSYVWN